MKYVPKMDFLNLDLAKMKLGAFGTSGLGTAEAEGQRAARAARMSAALGRFQRRQADAFARWAEGRDRPAEPAGTATIDMEAPKSPNGAWTAPDPAAAPNHAAPDGADIASAVMRTVRDSLAKGGIPTGGFAEGFAGGFVQPGKPAAAVPAGARFEDRVFTAAAGSRRYKVYVPSGYTGQALPVILMLHGCTQNPDDFAAGTQMNRLAEEQTFLVAYPEQPQSANMQRCWNWYAAGDQARDGGEPALLAGIAQAVVKEFSADPDRVYAAGLSAGGAAAAILAATYPDLFAAVGVHSGLACGSARDVASAFAAMKGQGGAPGRNRQAVPTIVFHGDGDRTVHPANGDQVVAQAMAVSGLAETVEQGKSPGGVAYTRTVRSDGTGQARLEYWVLHGAGHAWSGGSPDGSFTDPSGPDASRAMVRFFLGHTRAAGAGRA
ncbi:extracellular catalytic domain type 1 short-chain-length polyhydroxyalkanoate depolymerase [Methylobacterium pseudosasicola]|uniref:Esterase, PHB depolymerase family n=1 Tax=Methylobacterium pseudosasicola TaxID=582667 RepID=A0A1I4G0V0_9HYPH|nr:PHB depolymerase family esterase [Methylobacterium pseudosasicola]SFL23758.1 esterase, PHB depolymerase family [Methylobacterium pseudosasicola]